MITHVPLYTHTHGATEPHSVMSRYCVFKVATCCFPSSCACQGRLTLLFNEHQLLPRLPPGLAAAATLTRRDTRVRVPGLIAATWLIVLPCSALIDSLDSGREWGGNPVGTQRQTNLGVQSIADARVTAVQRPLVRILYACVRVSFRVCVCERCGQSLLLVANSWETSRNLSCLFMGTYDCVYTGSLL